MTVILVKLNFTSMKFTVSSSALYSHLAATSKFYDNKPIKVPVSGIATLFSGCSGLKEKTLKIRECHMIFEDMLIDAAVRMNAKEEADRLKKQTPMLFPNVMLEGGKDNKNIKYFLPKIGTDIDHVSEQRVAELMNILRGNPHVFMAQPSSSNRGIHAIIATDAAEFLNENWDGSHVDAFNFVYDATIAYIEAELNEKTDPRMRKPVQGLAICYDETTYINLDAEPLHIDTSDYVPKAKKTAGKTTGKTGGKKSRKTVGEDAKPKVSLDDVINDVQLELDNHGATFDEGGRNAYVYQLAAICNAYGVDIDEVMDYCQQKFAESDFTEQEIATTVRSAYTKEENHGTRKRKRHHGSYEEIMNIINDYGEWRYNELKMMYEVKETGSKVWRSADDKDYNDLYLSAKEQNIITTPGEFRTFIGSHQTLHVNPIKEYLENLPKCTILPDGRCKIDGREETRDYIAEVFAHIHSTTNAETVAYYGKKWAVQMVKTWINSRERNEIVLGLLGPQGKYKTTFFKFLLPPDMQEDYFDIKSDPGLFNKDEYIKMCNHLIYVQEEFDAMGKQQLNQFKAVVSQSHINVRPPYFKDPIVAHKSCSFAFTGNEREILNDYTGNRRFVPFYIESIDNPYQYKIDHEAFYSQAYALAQEDSGFISYIESGEQELLDVHNQAFTLIDDEDELIEKYLGKPANSTAGVWETIGIITNYLQQQAFKPTLSKRKTGAYLRKKKFEHKNSNRGEVFYVIYLTRAEIESRAKMENNEENDAA